MTPAVCTITAGVAAVAIADAIRSRRALYRLKCAQAETVASALGGSVIVDDIELPKPDDSRWRLGTTRNATGDRQYMLLFGDAIRVGENVGIYIGDTQQALRIDVTPNTKNYCVAVWKAYRSRVARKAIDSTP